MATTVLPLVLGIARCSGAAESPGLRAAFHRNAMLTSPTFTTDAPVESGRLLPNSVPGGQQGVWTMRWDGVLSGAADGELITMAVSVTGGVRLWVHQWKVVEVWDRTVVNATHTARWDFTWDSTVQYLIRIEYISATASPAQLSLQWRRGNTSTFVPVPTSSLSPAVPAPELQRQQMQAALGQGFNTWWRPSATTHVHLPTGFGIKLSTLDTVSNSVITGGVVDRCSSDSDCTVRPGPHTYNGSYTRLTTRIRGNASAPTLSVVTESAHVDGAGGHAVVLLMTAVPNAGASPHASPHGILFNMSGEFYFDCLNTQACGAVATADDGTITATPAGFAGLSARWIVPSGQAAGTPDPDGRACVVVAWANSSGQAAAAAAIKTISDCVGQVAAQANQVDAELTAKYGAVGTDNRDTVDAMRSVVGWNTMWDPRIKVSTPVSRSFGQMPFEMWLWDTYFCTLLASEASKELAYSNLIEITRPTVRGNVPGFRTAATTVSDRSKPFVGAFVLLEHYRKFGDLWIVELLYPSLLMWLKWIARSRVGKNGLVFLGTDNLPRQYADGAQCTAEAARWESGLDNSPMYDGLGIIKAPPGETCALPIYDVGMTGLYLSMCTAMAELAGVIGKNEDIPYFEKLGNVTAAAAGELMWNSTVGVHQNVLFSGDQSPRVSPFNLHMLLSGAASPEQAGTMASAWLMSPHGFCLTNASHPAQPAPSRAAGTSPQPSGGVLELYWSHTESDNAICSDNAGCPATVNHSAGYAHYHDSSGQRNEGQAEIKAVDGTRELRRYYSSSNADNMVGFAPPDESYVDLGGAGVWVHLNATATATWPFDLYWDGDRKDYQNIGNPLSRGYAGNYKHVARLGWVVPTTTPAPPTPPPPPTPLPGCHFGLPSISASDPAYGGSYWRGRTWGPMNFLVWKGLGHPKYAGVPAVKEAKARLATASQALLLQEWREHGHVHENYDPDSGVGDNIKDSNPFYTWGALLGFLALAEQGLI